MILEPGSYVMPQISSKVIQSVAVALQIPPEELTEDSNAESIENWDSMGTMNILLGLESDFGLRLSPGQTNRLQSITGIMELLQEAGKLQ
jgi:acyl carrier protein